jgi:hypothetical protein
VWPSSAGPGWQQPPRASIQAHGNRAAVTVEDAEFQYRRWAISAQKLITSRNRAANDQQAAHQLAPTRYASMNAVTARPASAPAFVRSTGLVAAARRAAYCRTHADHSPLYAPAGQAPARPGRVTGPISAVTISTGGLCQRRITPGAQPSNDG